MYHDPKTVLSPRDKVNSVEIIYDTGPIEEGSWSVARLEWDHNEAIGIRWNGDGKSRNGLPQARGNPAWFIVPKELEEAILNAAQKARQKQQEILEEGYREMAADRERELEAEEWTEGLIGDAL